MKIYGNRIPGTPDGYKAQRTGRNDAAGETCPGEKTAATDRVQLSGKAKEIAELKVRIGQLPEIRTDKVREIEKTIADGTYKVDSGKIAGKMIDELV